MTMKKRDSDDNSRYTRRLRTIEERNEQLRQHEELHAAHHIGEDVQGIKTVRRVANRHRVLSLLLPFMVVLLVSLYVVSPLSKVNRVQISGNKEVSDEAVCTATGVQNGRYIWGLIDHANKVQAQAQKKNHQIKTVEIAATGLRSVRVSITENSIIGLVSVHGQQHYLLSNGSQAPVHGRVPNYVTYANFSGHASCLRKTARQVGQLPRSIREGISELELAPTKASPERVKLYMNDGNLVIANIPTLARKMKYYPSIASSMSGNGVINIQVGAYSYPYGNNKKK